MPSLRICWCFVVGQRRALFTGLLFVAALERGAWLACADAWGLPAFPSIAAALAGLALAMRALRSYARIEANTCSAEFLAARVASDEAVRARVDGAVVVIEALPDVVRASVDVLPSVVVDTLTVAAVAVYFARLSILTVAIVAVGAAMLLVARRRAMAASDDAFARSIELRDEIVDGIEGREEIAAAGAASRLKLRLRGSIRRWCRADLRAHAHRALATKLPMVVVGVAVFLAWRGDLLSTRQIALLAAVAPAAGGVSRSIQEAIYLVPRLRPLAPFLGFSGVGYGPADAAQSAPPSVLEWRSVTLSYEARTVLYGVGFVARRGQMVALAGPNGSGKTSVFRVALGLRPAGSGAVFVDGAVLSPADLQRWRTRVSYLPQRPYFPPRDVAAAGAFPNVDATNAEVEAALRRLEPRTWLEASGALLRVPVLTLSAGERQRLALARVLLRDADVYLLDEPDANLDAAGVTMVVQIVRELAEAGKIVVVAAHTPELIAAADRVVHLEAGRVVRVEERPRTAGQAEVSPRGES